MYQQMPIKMDSTMADVLDVFVGTDGYATTGYLVDELGSTRPTISKRLDRLHAADHIEYVHEPTAFWRLVSDPRKEGEGDE
jgi:Mn-dependent DtxR family transcriptional regulator